MAVFGVLAVAIRESVGAAAVVGLLWSAPAVWWGWRCTRWGVVAEGDELVVRNLPRTHRVGYGDIADVRVQRREPSHRLTRAWAKVFNRAVVVVDVVGRDKPIELSSTESYLPMLRHSRSRTAHDVEAIRSVWLERTLSS